MNDDFQRKIIALHGAAGKKWLDAIPELVKKYEQEWQINVLPPFQLSYNYVCPVVISSGGEAVLKLSLPGDKESLSECEALKRFPEEVIIKILKSDMSDGALLLERANPGLPIKEIRDDKQQIHLVAEVIKKLHRPVTAGDGSLFPSLADWFKVFKRYRDKCSDNGGPIPNKTVDLGEKIFTELLQDDKEQVLLHGDLHNDNILSSQRGWLVIDPKGLIGEREFELAAFLRNPYFDLPKGCNYRQLQTDRILQLSEELGFDKQRVHAWAIAGAVISLLWFWEDEGEAGDIYLENVKLLNELKV